MYLYSRTVQLTGDPRKSIPFAIDLADFANKKSDLQVSLWRTVLGAPIGTLGYSAFVQSQAQLDAVTSSLLADPEYLERAAEAQQHFAGPPQDQLVEILHNAGQEYRRAEVGWIVNVVAAQVANARFGAAMKWSIEIADLGAEITGNPTIFGRSVAGPFGTVGWITAFRDMAAVDAANEALNKDPRYLAKLDDMSDVFLPGSGHTSILSRIA
jgi:hypothetical protein